MGKIVVLIPAHNEEASLALTIESVLGQERLADEVVVIPNGCTDSTAEVARQYPVTVLELGKLEHRKSEALNTGWDLYCREADIVVCLDADTVLPPNALGDWEQELLVSKIGGSTAKFTVQQKGLWGRLQKAEYAINIQQGLTRGWTNVLAGAGTSFSGEALKTISSREDRVGPWTYTSAVEDYELTYRLRELGLKTVVSPTVRAYTDGMKDLRSLWGQRIKWTQGTIEDLIQLGWNPLTRKDWLSQIVGLAVPMIRILWLMVVSLAVALDSLTFSWWGWLFFILFASVNVKDALGIPHKDKIDMFMAVIILPVELLRWVRGGWVLASWSGAIRKQVTGTSRDLWEKQYKAEGVV